MKALALFLLISHTLSVFAITFQEIEREGTTLPGWGSKESACTYARNWAEDKAEAACRKLGILSDAKATSPEQCLDCRKYPPDNVWFGNEWKCKVKARVSCGVLQEGESLEDFQERKTKLAIAKAYAYKVVGKYNPKILVLLHIRKNFRHLFSSPLGRMLTKVSLVHRKADAYLKFLESVTGPSLFTFEQIANELESELAELVNQYKEEYGTLSETEQNLVDGAIPSDGDDASELEKSIYIVLDTSGSMSGTGAQQAQGALNTYLNTLENFPNVKVGLIAQRGGNVIFPPAQGNVYRIRNYINPYPTNGYNPFTTLGELYNVIKNDTSCHQIILVTDGVDGNRDAPDHASNIRSQCSTIDVVGVALQGDQSMFSKTVANGGGKYCNGNNVYSISKCLLKTFKQYTYQNGECKNKQGKIGLDKAPADANLLTYFDNYECMDVSKSPTPMVNTILKSSKSKRGSKFDGLHISMNLTGNFDDVSFVGTTFYQNIKLDGTFNNVSFAGAKIKFATIKGSFSNVDFQGADLYKAKIKFTLGNDVNFDNARMLYANISGPNTCMNNISFNSTNLESASFTDILFCNANFSNIISYYVNFTKVKFHSSSFLKFNILNSSFKTVEFNDGIFGEAELKQGNFEKVKFLSTKINRSSFGSTHFTDVDFKNTYIAKNNFSGTSFTRGSWDNVTGNQANFSGTKITDLKIRNSNFRKSDFSRAQLLKIEINNSRFDEGTIFASGGTVTGTITKSNFSYSNMNSITLEAEIRDSIFKNAILLYAKLKGSKFINVDLRSSKFGRSKDFKDAIFDSSDLSHAKFEEVQFNPNNMSNLKFFDAYFSRVEFLNGAHFKNLDFSSADFDQVNINGAEFINANFSNLKRLLPMHSFVISDLKCSGCQFSGFTLEPSLSKAEFNNTTFQNMVIEDGFHGKFNKSDFEGVIFESASIGGEFTETNFRLVDFTYVTRISNSTFKDVQFLPPSKLQHTEFKQVTFENTTFHNTDLLGTSFKNVDWKNSHLTEVNLEKSYSNKVNFSNTHLTKSKLQDVHWLDVTFNNSYLDETDLTKSRWANPKFIKTSFQGVKGFTEMKSLGYRDPSGFYFEQTNLKGFDLTGLHLSQTEFKNCDLEDVDWKDGSLSIIKFVNTSLKGANLNATRLEYLSFEDQSNVSNAFFSTSILKFIKFKGAIAKGLRGLNGKSFLKEALDFERTDLSDTNFSGSTFFGTSFRDSWLIGTDFQGANLHNVQITNTLLDSTNFTGAKIDNVDFEGSDTSIAIGL